MSRHPQQRPRQPMRPQPAQLLAPQARVRARARARVWAQAWKQQAPQRVPTEHAASGKRPGPARRSTKVVALTRHDAIVFFQVPLHTARACGGLSALSIAEDPPLIAAKGPLLASVHWGEGQLGRARSRDDSCRPLHQPEGRDPPDSHVPRWLLALCRRDLQDAGMQPTVLLAC